MEIQLKEKTQEIAEILANYDFKSLSILSGNTSSLFLFSYLAEYTHEEKYFDLVESIIVDTYNRIQNGEIYIDFSYSNGISGFLWALKNLKDSGHIDLDLEDFIEDTIPSVIEFMFDKINEGNFDFLHGALGPANFILEIIESFPQYKEDLIKFNTLLLEKGILTDDYCLYYVSKVNKGNEIFEDVANLSLSHGLASVIDYLIKCQKNASIATQENENAILKCINFFKKYQNKDIEQHSYFPSWAKLENHIEFSSRMAWCYGDLGTGLVLYRASLLFNDEQLKNYALNILIHTTKRIDPAKENVVEGNFCHGSAGLVETYKTIYELTNNILFKEAADYWLQVTLDLAIHEDGYAGYKTYHSSTNSYHNNLTLLEGASGIAIVFLGELMQKSLPWKKALLL